MAIHRSIVFVLIAFAAGLASLLWWLSVDPRVVMLKSDGPAKWIRAGSQFNLGARRDWVTQSTFKKRLTGSQTASTLRVTALRRVIISLDGRQIFDSGPDLQRWKSDYSVPITLAGNGGSHELTCVVFNEGGPDLLRVSCPDLGLYSDSQWLARVGSGEQAGLREQGGQRGQGGRGEFTPAVDADAYWDPGLMSNLRPSVPGIVCVPIGVGLLVLVAILAGAFGSQAINWALRLRWLLLVLWIALAVNNIFKVPLGSGYDVDSHYDYILYVLRNRALPAPNAGWQYFQSPLYYVISAGLCRLLIAMGQAPNTILHLLRCIPLVCGAVVLEVSYRIGRAVYPGQRNLQMITTLVGGWLPVNFYMSQTVSNEPMAGAIGALILLLGLRFVIQPQTASRLRMLFLAGILLGIGWITKISTVVWLGPMGMAIGYALTQQKVKLTGWVRTGAVIAFSALVVSSWLFIRNYHQIGKPFFLEASVTDAPWWQDPGFRTPSTLYEFGHVFSDPIHHVISSVWDSLYATCWGTGVTSGNPPWNLRLVFYGAWLAALPASAVVLGMLRSPFARSLAPARPALLWAIFTLGCFVAAIVYVFLTLPTYCCAKTSYMLGATPCLGLLAAAGVEGLMNYRFFRAIIGGVLACWMVTVYLSYFA